MALWCGRKYLGPLKNSYGYATSLAVWGNSLLIQLDQGDSRPGWVETDLVAGRQWTSLVGARAGLCRRLGRRRS